MGGPGGIISPGGGSPEGGQAPLGRRRHSIALLLPRFSRYGGVEQFGYRLAECLAAKGYAVDFICARQEVEPPPGVRVLPVGRPPGAKVVKMLWFLLRAEQKRRQGNYDLSISLGKTWNQDLSRLGGGPLRVFWEKSESSYPLGVPRLLKGLARRLAPSNWLTLLIERRQFSGQTEVVAVSHRVRDWLLASYPGIAPEQVSVIYNMPDLGRFSPPSAEERRACRARLMAIGSAGSAQFGGAKEASFQEGMGFGGAEGPSPFLLGTASTNFRLKGVGPLIQALAQFPHPAYLFVAGGRGSGKYQHLARELGLERRVCFCGRVEDMPAFYRGLDLFILPTFYDACSNAVLEALASGCRVITSQNNGAAHFLLPEAVLDDPGDAAEIARCMERVLQAPFPAGSCSQSAPGGMEGFLAKIEGLLGVKDSKE